MVGAGAVSPSYVAFAAPLLQVRNRLNPLLHQFLDGADFLASHASNLVEQLLCFDQFVRGKRKDEFARIVIKANLHITPPTFFFHHPHQDALRACEQGRKQQKARRRVRVSMYSFHSPFLVAALNEMNLEVRIKPNLIYHPCDLKRGHIPEEDVPRFVLLALHARDVLAVALAPKRLGKTMVVIVLFRHYDLLK